MTTQKPRVLVLATPQGEVKGNAGFYSNIRRRNPNPSAPMITGLLKTSFREAGVDAEVTQVDARSDKFGEVKERVYAKFRAPYIDEELTKYYYGISPAAIEGLVRNSDIICFTSHFTGSSGVVKMFIREAKRMNPNAEVWIGGNDVPGPRQDSYRAAGADRFWVGDVFRSLPAYIHERWGGTVKSCSLDVDHKRRGTYMLPIPSYMGDIVYLTKFSDCAEGPYPGRDEDFRPAVYTEFNKGCFHKCPFCTSPMTRSYFASMPLEEIEKHLGYYKKLGVKTIIMMDDNILGPIIFSGNREQGMQYVISMMELINSYGFNVEFGNGIQLAVLLKYWDEISEPLFRNCFRFYMPVEDLASETKRLAKLPRYEQELDLFGRVAKGIGNLKQVTIGIIIGSPHDDEAGLERTVQRMEEMKGVFRGSHIEMAFTPYMNKLLPNTKNFIDFYPQLTVYDINIHPELYFFSLVSNTTQFISDPRVLWEAWLRMLQVNPAEGYLENFRRTGEVKLAKVI